MHDTTIMHKGQTGFDRLSHSSEKRAQTAKARAQVSEELLITTEKREAKMPKKELCKDVTAAQSNRIDVLT